MINRLFQGRNSLPLILQAETAECGLACLAMVAGFHGFRIDIHSLRSRHAFSAAGASVKHLLDTADSIALQGRPLKLELEDVKNLKLPAILHWDMDHFVVLKKISARSFSIHDPAIGVRKYRKSELGNHFTGVAIEFAPAKSFSKKDLQQVNKLRDLISISSSFYRTALQVFLLSLFIQLLSLTTPLYLQLVLDEGLAKRDMDIVLIVALVFLTISIARAVVGYLRGLVLIYFSNQLGFQMVSNVFNHLLRLPQEFFDRREMGDIVSRFSSLDSIKQMVTQEMITVVVDGLFSITTLILLFIYSPLLAAIALGFMALFTVIRLITIPIERNRRQEVLVAEAKQKTRFMENIRGISITKNYGIEKQRTRHWQNSFADYINTGYQLSHFQLATSSLQTLIFGIDHIATIYFGSRLVFELELTVGQLMSFVFLKQHFTSSVSAMIPKLMEIRLLRLQLERVADITFTEAEYEVSEPPLMPIEIEGRLTVKNLSYRYPGTEKPIFSQLSFNVDQGECLAITGTSGSGKSTLLKVLLGLLKPEQGEVLIDGRGTQILSAEACRNQIAAVLHDETLLAGSLSYNISLNHLDEDQQRLRRACELAGIYQDIMTLPLGFYTQVGEMGSVLSAGQMQRLFLARALYRQPRLLILDEGLSHLCQDMALALLENLLGQNITIIMVTHNENLARLASQRIHLQARCFKPLPEQSAA